MSDTPTESKHDRKNRLQREYRTNRRITDPEYAEREREDTRKWYANRTYEVIERQRQLNKTYGKNGVTNKEYYKRKRLDPEWVERDRARRRAYDKTHAKAKRNREVKERKQHILDLIGGKCRICGYSEHLCSIDFHETEKLFKPSPAAFLKSKVKFQRLLDGIHVLIPLCKNCHAAYHRGLVDIPEQPSI